MSDFLKFAGSMAILGGTALIFFAFRIDINAYPQGLGDPVANMAQMHYQLMWFLLGAFLALIGVVSVVGGAILDQLRSETNRVLGKAKPDPVPEIYA